MANRWYNQFRGSLEKGLVDAADGYVGLPNVTDNIAGATVSRVSTGLYKIVLDDYFARIVSAQYELEATQAQALWVQGAGTFRDGAVATTNVNEVRFRVVNSSGAVTDPTSSIAVWVHVIAKNSGV